MNHINITKFFRHLYLFVLILSLIVFKCKCPLDTDIEPPKVKIISPIRGESYYVSVEIQIEATDNERLDRIEIYGDNNLLTTLTKPP